MRLVHKEKYSREHVFENAIPIRNTSALADSVKSRTRLTRFSPVETSAMPDLRIDGKALTANLCGAEGGDVSCIERRTAR